MKNALTVSLVLIVLSLTGCSSIYRTPGAESLALSELAVLEHDDPYGSGVIIEDVDGKWRGMGAKQRYELTPGEHSITVSLNRYGYAGGKITRWFNVRSGGSYTIKANIDTSAMRWGIYVIDKSSGKRIDVDTPVNK